MVLAVRECGYFSEQIFIVLVSMQFGTIKHTSASSRSTSICTSRLTAFKLLHQIVDFFLSVAFELLEFWINFFECRRVSTHPLISTTLMNLFIRNDYFLKIQCRQFCIDIFRSIISRKITKTLLKRTHGLHIWIKGFSRRMIRLLHRFFAIEFFSFSLL